jgi:hypothetical protein
MFDAIGERVKEDGIKKVFDWHIGQEYVDDADLVTLEGTQIKRLHVDYEENFLSRTCKAAITAIVYENYRRTEANKKRKANGLALLPLIPVLVCADIDGNRRAYNPLGIASKDPALNDLFTHSELRRAAKLACQFHNADIRAAARATFRFVKVKKIPSTTSFDTKIAFERIAAPWEHADWDKAWAEREKTSEGQIAAGKKPKKNEFPWREELGSLIEVSSPADRDKAAEQQRKERKDEKKS